MISTKEEVCGNYKRRAAIASILLCVLGAQITNAVPIQSSNGASGDLQLSQIDSDATVFAETEAEATSTSKGLYPDLELMISHSDSNSIDLGESSIKKGKLEQV